MSGQNWYQITRTLQQLDADEQRSKVESIPAELDGCTLLLIKKGEEPVKEYIYGDGEGIINAGQLADSTRNWSKTTTGRCCRTV